jgi:hypothetical protein
MFSADDHDEIPLLELRYQPLRTKKHDRSPGGSMQETKALSGE